MQQNPEHYSSLAARYEAAFSKNPALNDFLQTVLSHLPPSSEVLDVGCGTGKPVASTLAEAGHHVTGVDFSPEMIDLASKAVPEGTFTIADMRGYGPPQDMRFDAVLDILSLFILDRQETEGLIKRQASWLKPGGLLCIATIPADDVPEERVKGGFDEDGLCAKQIAWRFLGEDVTIASLLTREGWKSLLQSVGLEIVHSQADLFTPPRDADTDNEPEFFMIAKRTT